MSVRNTAPVGIPISSASTGTVQRGWRTSLASLLAVVLAFASLLGMGTSAAYAAGEGLSAIVTVNGDKYDGTSIVPENAQLTLKVQYGLAVGAGTAVPITLGKNVTLGAVPAANDAVESIVLDPSDPNTVLVTFKDPWPSGTNQGVIDLTFTVNEVEHSSKEPITWMLGDEGDSIDVIIKNEGDEFANVAEAIKKDVTNDGNLSRFVSYEAGTKKVVVNSSIIGAPIAYKLSVDTNKAETDYVISDLLPEGMTYQTASFTAKQTSWDGNGLNKKVENVPFVHEIIENTFTGKLDLPGPSKTEITYTASIADEAGRAALEAALQTKASALNDTTGGNFSSILTNTATFGPDATVKTKDVTVAGNVPAMPGPDRGKAFGKSADWDSKNVTPTDDGTLDPAVDVVYTLKTDLTAWDGTNVKKTLNSNVVISDKLPAQATWNVDGAEFLTSTEIALEKIAPVAADDFAGDAYISKYFVLGQDLYINVGKNNFLKADIKVKAKLNTVAGLSGFPGNNKYTVTNTANWGYTDDGTRKEAHKRDVTLNVPGPALANAFVKDADWNLENTESAEDGMLTPALDITYTLKTDLTPWDKSNVNQTLSPTW